MSKQAILAYYNKVERYKRYGGSNNESNIRRAFANLLEAYCNAKNLELIDELHLKGSQKRPDGTVKDAAKLDWGYWESKDAKDDLDKEIKNKIKIYPTDNILFENSVSIVLLQQGAETLRADMSDVDKLHHVLTDFTAYERPEIRDFRMAITAFAQDIPLITNELKELMAHQKNQNPRYQLAFSDFWELCRKSINPQISEESVQEMLIQHILTDEIFSSIFNDSAFHRENNIAKQLQAVTDTFFTGITRRQTLAKLDGFYRAIKAEAARIQDHHKKQEFLKIVYENFYKAYNPKAADRLGIVYTPQEIVRFMVESTDFLLEKHFKRALSDKNVHIFDPATGTGTFIVDLIDYFPQAYLPHKFKHELHANEVAILPYYIANLNIEYSYQQKMNDYQPFEHIVFIDTLDNMGFGYAGKQQLIEGFGFSAENIKRIERQNKHKISVIIGNPPYNANQQNENDNNKNRTYPAIDKRIKDSFIDKSTAQKTKVYDMYARFYRWAMDRIDKNGVIAFISNNSFINARTFDGFRKCIQQDFDDAYIIDLGGNIRELSGKDGIFLNERHTIFGQAAAVGIAMMFLIKKDHNAPKKAMIRYIHPCDIRATRVEKLDWLRDNPLKTIAFDTIQPDKNGNWIHQSENDFDTLIPLYSKDKIREVLFEFTTFGVSTNRDEWVYDFDKKNLQNKMQFFIDKYDVFLNNDDTSWNEIIKWSRDFKKKFEQKKRFTYDEKLVLQAHYRPFIKPFWYAEKNLNDIFTQNHYNIFGKQLTHKTPCITIHNHTQQFDFTVFITDMITDAGFSGRATPTIPLYRYDSNGNPLENITDWALQQFENQYVTSAQLITKKAIFHYVYAVLHAPAYRAKYALNLKRDFPRIPFYEDFWKWANTGEQLMDLHLNYEKIEYFPLSIVETAAKTDPKVKLKADKTTGEIIIDENTTLTGVPETAWAYKLGNRSALEWVLDQYKPSKPSDPTLAEKFNDYQFSDYKEKVIDLLRRVCRVSVETMHCVMQLTEVK
jgi:predicted helicase